MSESETPNPNSPENNLSNNEETQSTDWVENTTSPLEDELVSETETNLSEGTQLEDLPTLDFAKDSDWFAQYRRQRQRNRELIKKVAQLEQALTEAQEELQAQVVRSRSMDTLINQQTEELNSTKEQLTRLFEELESSHQTTQRQQVLIETLSEELEFSKEEVTELQKDYDLLQQQEQQQAQQLQQAKSLGEELREHLHHQQKQTRQFKAALDKCLETSSPPSPEENPLSQLAELSIPKTAHSSRVNSIQPWSKLLESQEIEPKWASKVVEFSPTEGNAEQSSQIPSVSEPQIEQPTTQSEEIPPPPERDTTSNVVPLSEFAPSTPESPPIHRDYSTSNWPSPVIYPLRSSEKRKSLASIDLPKFPRQQPS